MTVLVQLAVAAGLFAAGTVCIYAGAVFLLSGLYRLAGV